jgi:hypothetical protein
LAPQVGFEPTTLRLTAECSTVELLRSNVITDDLNLTLSRVAASNGDSRRGGFEGQNEFPE